MSTGCCPNAIYAMGLCKIGNLIKAKGDAAFSLVPRLSRCGRDLFYDLSASRQRRRGSALSRKRDLRFPPLISREKDGGLPPGTSENAASSSKLWREALGNSLLNNKYSLLYLKMKGLKSRLRTDLIRLVGTSPFGIGYN